MIVPTRWRIAQCLDLCASVLRLMLATWGTDPKMQPRKDRSVERATSRAVQRLRATCRTGNSFAGTVRTVQADHLPTPGEMPYLRNVRDRLRRVVDKRATKRGPSKRAEHAQRLAELVGELDAMLRHADVLVALGIVRAEDS